MQSFGTQAPAGTARRTEEKTSAAAFWDALWKTADRARLRDHIASFDAGGDPITRFLGERGAVRVCDAGCGCGVYARKLISHGFRVCGFDVSAEAAALARETAREADGFLAADILDTPYPDGAFDAVVARSVIDHMPLADGARAVRELLRITRAGGWVLLTLDRPDAQYEEETHIVSGDGDYIFCGGRWKGMVFHPYTASELAVLAPGAEILILDDHNDGFTAAVGKAAKDDAAEGGAYADL